MPNAAELQVASDADRPKRDTCHLPLLRMPAHRDTEVTVSESKPCPIRVIRVIRGPPSPSSDSWSGAARTAPVSRRRPRRAVWPRDWRSCRVHQRLQVLLCFQYPLEWVYQLGSEGAYRLEQEWVYLLVREQVYLLTQEQAYLLTSKD